MLVALSVELYDTILFSKTCIYQFQNMNIFLRKMQSTHDREFLSICKIAAILEKVKFTVQPKIGAAHFFTQNYYKFLFTLGSPTSIF